MTATERGSSKLRTAATAASRSRSSKLLDRVSGERRRQLDLDRVGARAELDREAALAEDVDHPVVVRQHLAMNVEIPCCSATSARCASRIVEIPLSLPCVGD